MIVAENKNEKLHQGWKRPWNQILTQRSSLSIYLSFTFMWCLSLFNGLTASSLAPPLAAAQANYKNFGTIPLHLNDCWAAGCWQHCARAHARHGRHPHCASAKIHRVSCHGLDFLFGDAAEIKVELTPPIRRLSQAHGVRLFVSSQFGGSIRSHVQFSGCLMKFGVQRIDINTELRRNINKASQRASFTLGRARRLVHTSTRTYVHSHVRAQLCLTAAPKRWWRGNELQTFAPLMMRGLLLSIRATLYDEVNWATAQQIWLR